MNEIDAKTPQMTHAVRCIDTLYSAIQASYITLYSHPIYRYIDTLYTVIQASYIPLYRHPI
jgi:hypothetical protein